MNSSTTQSVRGEETSGRLRLENRVATGRPRGEAGFTIIEFAVISVLLSVGLMGFLGAILTSQVMVRNSTARSKASTTVANVVEKFRLAATEDFEGTVSAAIGGIDYYRIYFGDFRVDVSDSEVQTSAVPTGAPPPVIPASVDLDSVGVTSVVVDEFGNTITTTTFVDGTGIRYERVITSYTTGSSGTTLTRVDLDGSMSMQAQVDSSFGPPAELNYWHDVSDGFTIYSSNIYPVPQTKPGLTLYGIALDDVDGSSIGIVVTDCLVDFESLASVGTDARLTVTVIADETAPEPDLDLNSDDDTEDVDLSAAELKAAVLRVVLTWKDGSKTRQVEYSTIFARRELR